MTDVSGPIEQRETVLYRRVSALIKEYHPNPPIAVVATEEEVQEILRALRYRSARIDCISVDETLFGSRDPDEFRHERAMEIANRKCTAKNLAPSPFTLFGIPIVCKDGTRFGVVRDGDYVFLSSGL
jgi:hypothetical protein